MQIGGDLGHLSSVVREHIAQSVTWNGACGGIDDLNKGSVGRLSSHLVAVSGERQHPSLGCLTSDLLGQATLAHPWLSAEYEDAAAAGERRPYPFAEGGHLGIAADQPGPSRARAARGLP